MDMITRTQAILEGKVYYYTGKPCKRGHVSSRRVSNYICIECSREVYAVRDREDYRNGDTFKRQYSSRMQYAKRNNIPFTIKYEDIEKPKYCPVFGIELNYGWSGLDRRDPAKATFDKLNPELGYVPGNVFVISWRANKLKSDMTHKELKQIIKYMRENNETI